MIRISPYRHHMRRVFSAAILIVITWCAVSLAGATEPITGARFDSLLALQSRQVQADLSETFPESDGFLVGGPLDPLTPVTNDAAPLYNSLHVLCPDLSTLQAIVATLKRDPRFGHIKASIENARRGNWYGYRGVMAEYESPHSPTTSVQFFTIQQLRWLAWAHEHNFNQGNTASQSDLRQYAGAVSDHLYAIDQGTFDAPEPKAVDFGLPATDDLYADPPPYVIEGYQNYKDYLATHADIKTDFASGILAFIPGDSLLAAFTADAPHEAFPNKEAPMWQAEWRKFFARGGDLGVLQTLTADGFDTLPPGEYFFAVGVLGEVRFGYEMLREEVERIETETGRKLPRANHSFLFPGEPILTAGAFFIKHRNGKPYIDHINAQSGHYFYSNVSPTIREDIAEKSNHYLLTLGHFFAALDRLKIPHDSVLIWKL